MTCFAGFDGFVLFNAMMILGLVHRRGLYGFMSSFYAILS